MWPKLSTINWLIVYCYTPHSKIFHLHEYFHYTALASLFLCRFHSSQEFITHMETVPFPIKGCNSIPFMFSAHDHYKQWAFQVPTMTLLLLSICRGTVNNLLQPSFDIWPCQANTVTSVPPLRWRPAKCRPVLVPYCLWMGRNLCNATHVVTWGQIF